MCTSAQGSASPARVPPFPYQQPPKVCLPPYSPGTPCRTLLPGPPLSFLSWPREHLALACIPLSHPLCSED